jgi:hypothetical protein
MATDTEDEEDESDGATVLASHAVSRGKPRERAIAILEYQRCFSNWDCMA